VGLFLLAGLLLLILGSFFLGGWHFRWEGGKIYYVNLPDAHRIGPDSPIEVAGVRVGKVTAVELDPQTHRVKGKIRIRRDLRVYDDAVLRIRTSGFLGDRFLELEPGQSGRELPEGSFIPKSTAPLSLEEILDSLTPVVENLKALTENLRTVSGSPSFQRGITETLENLQKLSGSLESLVRGNRGNIEEIFANVARVSRELREQLPRLSREFSSGIQDLQGTIGDLRPAIQRIVERLDRISQNLDETMARIHGIVARVERGEGTVGTLLNDPKTAENLRETASTLGNLARSYQNLKTIIEYRGQEERLVEFSRWGMRHTLNIRIQPREGKYYALGIVRAPKLVETLTVRTTTTQDPQSGTLITETTTRELTAEDRILFNLYLAWTFFSRVTLRGGILESSGGAGLDLHLLPELWDLRAEIFRFPLEGGTPYLRGWTEIRLFRHLLLTAGLEDILTPPRGRRYSVGAGIIFTDEDLKTLFLALPRINF
jgi:phospholipid/cholesterol/gamma-HCH transport system substrate-binding protein